MKLRFSYHSEHHADRTDRWRHFLHYAGALLLIIAGNQQLYYYFTHWSGSDGGGARWWNLALGLLCLMVGLWLAYSVFRAEDSDTVEATDRYVRVDERQLVWKLEQGQPEQRLLLAEVAAVQRMNVRQLDIRLRDGSVRSLPIFLVPGREKQDELIRTLTA